MNLLKEYIKTILREIYDLSTEDEKEIEKLKGFYDKSQYDNRRAFALQTREEQIADRTFLQKYQADLKQSSAGKKMISAFIAGSVTILHSTTYRGFTYRIGKSEGDAFYDATKWIKKYGKKGKDTLSTVAFPVSTSNSLPAKALSDDYSNAYAVQEARGVILKGYPVYVSEVDVMSQTLGAVPAKVKKHQAQSGIAKRPKNGTDAAPIYSLEHIKSLGAANEVLLDNWTVVGTYISYPEKQGRGALKETKGFVQESLKIGLPCNIYWQGKLSARIKNKTDYLSWLSEEKKGQYYV